MNDGPAPDGPDGPDGDDYYESFRRDGGRRRPRRGKGWVAGLVLVLVGVVVVGGGIVGFGKLKDRLAPAADYSGPGTGSVSFEVHQGDNPTVMGRNLEKEGVVKSAAAFVDAARKDARATTIQVGFYPLKRKMQASSALKVLVDPNNLVQSKVTVPEGARVRDVVKSIVAKTDFKEADVVAALKDPTKLGLPASAQGNPEGYLFPATYIVAPNATALSLLQQMVAKSKQVDAELDLDNQAKAKNLSPEQILTVASILEYEANRSQDYPKVARVVYNRLNQDMPLQLDSTVSYVSGRSGDVWTTTAERANDSDYNTYKHTGLPPGPIGSPGEETIKAALNPAKGNWLYFLPDFENDSTLFYDSDTPQRQKDLQRIKEFCQKSEKC